MTRRHGRWKAALALLSGLTVLAATTANGAPITMTEANWNENVNVHTELTADAHAGVNYARAVSSNGTLQYPLTGVASISGVMASVNNIDSQNYKIDTGKEPFSASGLLGIIDFDSEAQSCAQVGDSTCPAQAPVEDMASAHAYSNFHSMDISTLSALGLDVGPIARYNSATPIVATATCEPGQPGDTSVTFGGSVQLMDGALLFPSWKNIPNPEANESSPLRATRLLATYDATLHNIQTSGTGFARSEVHLTLEAKAPILSGWTLDIILARAECSVSRPLNGGVVPTDAGRGMTMNAVMDNALAVEKEDAEAEDAESGTLDDALAEADAGEPEGPETTTSQTSSSKDSEGDDAASTSTSSSTSATITTVPEIPRRTVTVTSEPPSTSTSTSTKAGTSTTKSTSSPTATSTTSTSIAATPSGSPPAVGTTTSTSAVPAIAIPDEPGLLSPTARIEDVDTITAGGEELVVVVVVEGTPVPTDAKQGAAALEIWLGGGNPSSTWKPFASADSERDGWRWAAINQKTGTIVYIR